MAFAEASPDILQAVAAIVIAAFGRPVVEQLRELHPSIELVERRYCCQEPIRKMVIMRQLATSSCSEPLWTSALFLSVQFWPNNSQSLEGLPHVSLLGMIAESRRFT
eukprot:8262577-Pyramimonas_sp.AAC.1